MDQSPGTRCRLSGQGHLQAPIARMWPRRPFSSPCGRTGPYFSPVWPCRPLSPHPCVTMHVIPCSTFPLRRLGFMARHAGHSCCGVPAGPGPPRGSRSNLLPSHLGSGPRVLGPWRPGVPTQLQERPEAQISTERMPIARPGRASPEQTWPGQSLLGYASPCLASPGQAWTCSAWPGLACVAMQDILTHCKSVGTIRKPFLMTRLCLC